jgi:ubiquinone/menaquinone biosynthesis C-methylase UbiE
MQRDYDYIKHSYQSSHAAGRYDQIRFNKCRRNILNRQLLNAVGGILNYVQRKDNKINSVLDMPCGTGRLFPLLMKREVNFIGADISKEMMWESDDKFNHEKNIPLIQCDGTIMPFKDKSFDAVICLRFLTTKIPPNVIKASFREMARVSSKWVIIECRNRTWANVLRDIVAKLFRMKPLVNYFTIDEIKRDLQESGIKLTKVFYPFGTFFANKMLVLGEVNNPKKT